MCILGACSSPQKKEKLEIDLKGYNRLLNQLKEAPDQDEASEQYKKAILEKIKVLKEKLPSLQPPAQRRSDLEASLLKAQNYIKMQNEQLDNREKKVEEEIAKIKERREGPVAERKAEAEELQKQIEAAKLEEGIQIKHSGQHAMDASVVKLLDEISGSKEIDPSVKHLQEKTKLFWKSWKPPWPK